MKRMETDVVIAGSGPGGGTLARELTRRGKNVVIVERGGWQNWPLGTLASMATVTQMIRSTSGGLMGRGITAGGSSVVFNGNAYEPPTWLKEELGIDLAEEVAEAREEAGVKVLPDSFYDRWPATRRLIEAAGEADVALLPQKKFINPDKCVNGCDDCMLGCRHGAKWTSRTYIKEAMEGGARILTRTKVNSVIRDNGEAKGVNISGPDGIEEIRAEKVVLAAGGIGTPIILLRSGVDAGEGFFIDPMNVIMGVGKDKGTLGEMSFSVASEEFVESDGFLVGTVGAFMVWSAQLTRLESFKAIFRSHQYKRIMGMFTKIGDTPGGRIHADGTIEKPYPAEDQVKFEKGTKACRDILVGAGADPDSITVARDIGGHPGGTAAIGRVVGKDLQVNGVKGLYVCDASVFPRSPGRPPTLTLISLAKHLAKNLQ